MTSIFFHLTTRRRAATILLLVVAIALMASTAHASNSKRLPKSWHKHIRRMKQAARKAGVAYTPGRAGRIKPAASWK